jgi:hypothetical protein
MDEPGVCLRFDEDLRFFLAPRSRQSRVQVPCDATSTIGHMVEALGVPLTEAGRIHPSALLDTTELEQRPGSPSQPAEPGPDRRHSAVAGLGIGDPGPVGAAAGGQGVFVPVCWLPRYGRLGLLEGGGEHRNRIWR